MPSRVSRVSRVVFAVVALGWCALGCSAAESGSDSNSGGTGAAALGGMGGGAAGVTAGATAGAGGMGALGGNGGAGAGIAGVGIAGVGGGSSAGSGTAGVGGVGGVGGSSGQAGGDAGLGGAGGDAGMSGAGGDSGADGGPVKSSGCGSASAPGSDTYTLDVGGTDRTYILRVPDDYDANHAYRLILSYHPLGGTAQAIAGGDYYGLWNMANGSTIFAAPQGIGNRWSDSGRTRMSGGEDIDFARALVDELTSTLCIDQSRIFAEGFSMGGSMSYAIACAMGDTVRGVVAHSGGPMSGCVEHDTPVAYFMTHGTQDNVCTYPEYGVPQIDDFASVNGCMPKEMPTPSGSDPACVDFDGCMPGYPARACIFIGGHTPSPPGGWVPTESWEFISQF